ncbi:MAG: 16S rRNA (cytosine1402-N4)-methyltransferase [Hyphomicrobiaceae bacterium]|jgi:16S rRNA (cytosine1402-N4)-methyltransferase
MADEQGSFDRVAGGQAADHIPVLLAEVVAALAIEAGDKVLDGTFGAGGYSRAILSAADDVNVIGFDQDPSAAAAAGNLEGEFPGRFSFHGAPFSTMAERVVEPVDAIVLDIGVSSMQIDNAERGFSFQTDGPLDMRMSAAHGQLLDARSDAPSAADLVNTLEEEVLANLIYQLGDERRSRSIARAICRRREELPFARTLDLAAVVAKGYGRPPKDGRSPATRTFQALRIAVNDELGELAKGLCAAETILKPGGRLVVVTFHSLEDRMIKRFFANRSGKRAGTSRHLPELQQFEQSTFQIVNQRPLTPGNQEIARNPRARSAKLRSGVRTEAPIGKIDLSSMGLPDWDQA